MSIGLIGNKPAVASLVSASAVDSQVDNPNIGNMEVPAELIQEQDWLLNKAELTPIVENLNRLMQELSADIQFLVHDKTKRLIVQVVDSSDGTVLKEFPPHELLDTIAKISEYVGVLLDKRA